MIEVFIGGIMSNQRPGKIEKKLDRNGDMQVYKFFKTAAKLLNESGKEDEAFYMELLDFWPLSIVVPGLLLSILWGAYAL